MAYMGRKKRARIKPNFLVVDVRDVITWFKFGDDRLRGLGSAEGQSLPFPIDFDGRPYNTLTLPCERVICCCAWLARYIMVTPFYFRQKCMIVW